MTGRAKKIIDAAYLALDRLADEEFSQGREHARYCFEKAHEFAMQDEKAERHDIHVGKDIEGYRELPETGARWRVIDYYANAVQVQSVSAAAMLPLAELYASALYDVLRVMPPEVEAAARLDYWDCIMPPPTKVTVGKKVKVRKS